MVFYTWISAKISFYGAAGVKGEKHVSLALTGSFVPRFAWEAWWDCWIRGDWALKNTVVLVKGKKKYAHVGRGANFCILPFLVFYLIGEVFFHQFLPLFCPFAERGEVGVLLHPAIVIPAFYK